MIPRLALSRSWTSSSGLVAADLGGQVDGTRSGTGTSDQPGDAGDDDLCHEHAHALAGAAELADVGAEVVGLDDPGSEPPSRSGVT